MYLYLHLLPYINKSYNKIMTIPGSHLIGHSYQLHLGTQYIKKQLKTMCYILA